MKYILIISLLICSSLSYGQDIYHYPASHYHAVYYCDTAGHILDAYQRMGGDHEKKGQVIVWGQKRFRILNIVRYQNEMDVYLVPAKRIPCCRYRIVQGVPDVVLCDEWSWSQINSHPTMTGDQQAKAFPVTYYFHIKGVWVEGDQSDYDKYYNSNPKPNFRWKIKNDYNITIAISWYTSPAQKLQIEYHTKVKP